MKMKDKITMQDILDNIKNQEIVKHVTKSGKILRWAVLTTKSGFAVSGRPSSTINALNDNVEIGEKVAIDNAISEMWAIMGYELSVKLYENKNVEWTPEKNTFKDEPDLNYEEQSVYDTRVKYFTDIEDVQMFVSEFVFNLSEKDSIDSFLCQSFNKKGAQQLDRIIKTMIRNKNESLMIVNYENKEYDDNLIDLIYQTVFDYIKPHLI